MKLERNDKANVQKKENGSGQLGCQVQAAQTRLVVLDISQYPWLGTKRTAEVHSLLVTVVAERLRVGLCPRP